MLTVLMLIGCSVCAVSAKRYVVKYSAAALSNSIAQTNFTVAALMLALSTNIERLVLMEIRSNAIKLNLSVINVSQQRLSVSMSNDANDLGSYNKELRPHR